METDKQEEKPMESKSPQKASIMHKTINEDKTDRQADKNNQAQEHNTNPRNSSIQEYMISSSNLDTMEEEPPYR